MADTDARARLWPALMARAQAGDRDAYNQLLKAMVPAIRGFVRKKIADEALIEDVIQETLMAIHRVRHTYDPQRPILPWVAAISAARAIDALRQREIVESVHLREQSLAQAAAENNLSLSAVKSLLHRAMLNLRKYGSGNHEKS